MKLDVKAALSLEAEAEYEEGLRRLDRLIKIEDELGPNERNELRKLARAIRIYEDDGTPLHLQGVRFNTEEEEILC